MTAHRTEPARQTDSAVKPAGPVGRFTARRPPAPDRPRVGVTVEAVQAAVGDEAAPASFAGRPAAVRLEQPQRILSTPRLGYAQSSRGVHSNYKNM